MIRRQSAPKPAKSLKTQRNKKDCCSRVGNDFQAAVPDFLLNDADYNCDSDMRELRVWNPQDSPAEAALIEYLTFAKSYKYDEESAMLLLHWHGYNIPHAYDDIPNYVPLSSKWTKSEIRKFLESIDSKPRKNFVEAKKMMPGRPMGEISQLYYSIAAPFKAPTRGRHHGELIRQCYSRAVRNGLLENRFNPSPANYKTRVLPPSRDGTSSDRLHPAMTTSNRRLGEAADTLESEIETYLTDVHGPSNTRRLLGRRMLSAPYPLSSTSFLLPPTEVPQTPQGVSQSGLVNGGPSTAASMSSRSNSPTRLHSVPMAYQPFPPLVTTTTGVDNTSGSSGPSSQMGSESTTRIRSSKFCLPSRVHYDHAEFVSSLSLNPPFQPTVDCLSDLNSDDDKYLKLLEMAEASEQRAQAVLNKIGTMKPTGGFPKISYRWSKTELALVLTAMSIYGSDFAQIARTVGSKTENFIRDFYNQFRHQFAMDDIIRYAEPAAADAPSSSMLDSDLQQPRSPKPEDSPDTTVSNTVLRSNQNSPSHEVKSDPEDVKPPESPERHHTESTSPASSLVLTPTASTCSPTDSTPRTPRSGIRKRGRPPSTRSGSDLSNTTSPSTSPMSTRDARTVGRRARGRRL